MESQSDETAEGSGKDRSDDKGGVADKGVPDKSVAERGSVEKDRAADAAPRPMESKAGAGDRTVGERAHSVESTDSAGRERPEPPVSENGSDRRASLIAARGTSDGLTLRLDARASGESLLGALKIFISARRGFLQGNGVALEWVGGAVDPSLPERVKSLLQDEFGIQIREVAQAADVSVNDERVSTGSQVSTSLGATGSQGTSGDSGHAGQPSAPIAHGDGPASQVTGAGEVAGARRRGGVAGSSDGAGSGSVNVGVGQNAAVGQGVWPRDVRSREASLRESLGREVPGNGQTAESRGVDQQPRAAGRTLEVRVWEGRSTENRVSEARVSEARVSEGRVSEGRGRERVPQERLSGGVARAADGGEPAPWRGSDGPGGTVARAASIRGVVAGGAPSGLMDELSSVSDSVDARPSSNRVTNRRASWSPEGILDLDDRLGQALFEREGRGRFSAPLSGSAVLGPSGEVDLEFWDQPEGRIIYHTLRSGERLETEHSVVIFGDVNAGAEVIAGGDIVVLGTLRGIAHAGAYEESGGGRVIFALSLRPTQLRIGSVISRGSDAGRISEGGQLPEIARVDGAIIVVERYLARTWSRVR